MDSPFVDAPHGLVGQSPQICRIRHLIEKLARNRSAVLLLGESGTGKEVVARAIHDANPAGQFVPIDCGSLVGPLMESELFGHTKGAFTGAGEAKKGLIELANGGTAFFDEIGDLPLDMQVKLLRLLQEREYRPVGSLKRYAVDIRVIAATHRDLRREVAAGRFRQDLFYRLNVVTVHLPPLREHKEDVPLLIDYFLARAGGAFRLEPDVREAMLAYDWPGNVRELQNAVDRMVAINSGGVIAAQDMPSALFNHLAAAASPGPVDSADPGPVAHLSIGETERRAIREALEHTKGDRTRAAQVLGIGRTTLYRKIKDYKL